MIRGDVEMLKQYPKRGDLLAVLRNLPEIETIWLFFKEEIGLIGRMWGKGSDLVGTSIPLICRAGTIVIHQVDAKGPIEMIVHRDQTKASPEFEEAIERIWEIIRQQKFPYLELDS